jgi:DNA-binding FrmR family transcriptional regulator
MIDTIKKRLTHRTKIIAGQVGGIEKMIEDERYCLDTMNQIIAIQKSLASLNKLLLENHIRTHLSHQLASKDKKEIERAVSEMVKLYGMSVASVEANTEINSEDCCK